MFRQKWKKRLRRGIFSSLNDVRQPAPGSLLVGSCEENGFRALRSLRIGSQAFPHRCQPKASGARFSENSRARKQTHQAMERRSMGMRNCSQIGDAPRTVFEQIGDSKFSGDINRARQVVSGD